MEKVH